MECREDRQESHLEKMRAENLLMRRFLDGLYERSKTQQEESGASRRIGAEAGKPVTGA
jgi:hypothetical protein